MKKVVINEDGIFVPVDKETAIFLAKKRRRTINDRRW